MLTYNIVNILVSNMRGVRFVNKYNELTFINVTFIEGGLYIYWIEDSVMYITIYLTSGFHTFKLVNTFGSKQFNNMSSTQVHDVGHCKTRRNNTLLALFVKESHECVHCCRPIVGVMPNFAANCRHVLLYLLILHDCQRVHASGYPFTRHMVLWDE